MTQKVPGLCFHSPDCLRSERIQRGQSVWKFRCSSARQLRLSSIPCIHGHPEFVSQEISLPFRETMSFIDTRCPEIVSGEISFLAVWPNLGHIVRWENAFAFQRHRYRLPGFISGECSHHPPPVQEPPPAPQWAGTGRACALAGLRRQGQSGSALTGQPHI